MKKKIALILVSTLFCSGVYADTKVLTPEKGGTPNKEFSEQQAPVLTVATYNMAAGRVSDLTSVAKAIKGLNADLIALNEVDMNTQRSGKVDQVNSLAKLTGMHGAFGKAIDFEGGEYGIAVLSRYPIDKQQVFTLPSGNGEQRVLLVTQVHKPGLSEPILFMTTHLDWQQDPTIRLQQIREIDNVITGSTDSQFSEIASRIKILAGDFNDVAGSKVLNEMQTYWTQVSVQGKDMRSWPAANPAVDLDHIFTFKGQRWNVESLNVPNQKAQWRSVNWPATSDHVPVVATLKLTEQ